MPMQRYKPELRYLTSFWPGEVQIMDKQNHQIVEKIISPPDHTKVAVSVNRSSGGGTFNCELAIAAA